MKIALLTHYLPTERENYQNLANLTLPNRQAYCDKHGYEHWIQCGPYKYPDWYYAYDRLVNLREKLDQRPDVDFVFVLNIQSIISNFNIKIESLIDENHDFWVSKDINFINCGAMIFRNCQWTKEWLDFIISKEPVYKNAVWHEQKCIIDNWSQPKWVHRINLVPQYFFNSYDYTLYNWSDRTNGMWKKGHFVLSLPGLNLQQRIDYVNKFFNEDKIIL